MRRVRRWWRGFIVGSAACALGGALQAQAASGNMPSLRTDRIDLVQALPQADLQPLPATVARVNARWTPARWADLPGFFDDDLSEAWHAWILSCSRASVAFALLCGDVRRLSIGSAGEQRAWMLRHLQPYRVETSQGIAEGLLTGYYEPMLEASRQQTSSFSVPIYRLPSAVPKTGRWFSRQEIDSSAQAKAALQGYELAWLSDPLDALVLQIQGSGRLRVGNSDGTQQTFRAAYAGSNGHPYKSVGRWLLDQGLARETSWPAIKAWAAQNPQRVNEMLWSNPRTVFFREEPLSAMDAALGPKGAQGVELTPGRSIAVDPGSIPYGTPVWLSSVGPGAVLHRLVLAQDTGSAITGAVRADFFAGWGDSAQELAGRLKQGLRLWVLWPKAATAP